MCNRKLYIIAGCNGAGITTASFTILPEILDCKEFINADEIARGLSPFQPEKVAVEAGRIMLNRINELIDENENFAFETTLATRSYKSKILEAREKDYTVILLFFWLNSMDLAIKRVNNRVKEGGHFIAPEVIKRRYKRGISNLKDLYLPVVDRAYILDNTDGSNNLTALKEKDNPIIIFNQKSLNQFFKMVSPEIIDEKSKIVRGLELAFERLLEFKKQKNSPLIIMKDNKIIEVSADEFIKNRSAYHKSRPAV